MDQQPRRISGYDTLTLRSPKGLTRQGSQKFTRSRLSSKSEADKKKNAFIREKFMKNVAVQSDGGPAVYERKVTHGEIEFKGTKRRSKAKVWYLVLNDISLKKPRRRG